MLACLLVLITVKLTAQVTWTVALNGNNSNAGTFEAPFETINYAINRAEPGDTIQIRGGHYHLTDRVRVVKNDLTIRSVEGEWAILETPINVPNIPSTIFIPGTVSGVTIENMELIGGYYYAIFLSSTWTYGSGDAPSNITIRGCSIHSSGRDCVKLSAGTQDVLIEGNRIFNSGIGPSNAAISGGNAEGIDIVNGHRVIVRGNFIYNTNTRGVYTKGGSRDNIFENNLLMDTGKAAIMSGYGTDRDFYDVVAYQEGFMTYNHIIRNNIVIRSGETGIILYSTKGSRVYNNTVIYTRGVPIGVNKFPSSRTSPPEDIVIMNNIVYQGPGYGPAGSAGQNFRPISVSLPDSGIAHSMVEPIVIDHNLYFDAAQRPIVFSGWRTGGTATFDSLWKHLGFDLNSVINQDPLFENLNEMLGRWNVHLTANSPAIGRGGDTGGMVRIDYDGDLRLAGNNDIGADQYNPLTQLAILPPSSVVGTGWNMAEPPTPVFTAVRISPKYGIVYENGQQIAFTATPLDQYGSAIETTLATEWSVNSGGNGSISSNGEFTSITAGGPYEVSATIGDFSATAEVFVRSTPIASEIVLTAYPDFIYSEEQWQFSGEIRDQYGERIEDLALEWNLISGPASLSANGLLVADEAVGEVVIEVSHQALLETITMQIVEPPPPILPTNIRNLEPLPGERRVSLNPTLKVWMRGTVSCFQGNSDPAGLRVYKASNMNQPIFTYIFNQSGNGVGDFAERGKVEFQLSNLEPATEYVVLANAGWVNNNWITVHGFVETATSPTAANQSWRFTTLGVGSIELDLPKNQINTNEQISVSAIIRDINGDVLETSIRWEVEGNGTIDEQGNFTAGKSAGLSTIYAYVGADAYQTISIEVAAPSLLITRDIQENIIKAGEQIQFGIEISNLEGDLISLPVEWFVAGAGSIDQSGLFTASSEGGSAEITALVDGIHYSSIDIQVLGIADLVETFTLESPKDRINTREQVTLTITILDIDGEALEAPVAWELSGPGSISETGTYTAGANSGIASITARISETLSRTIEIEVVAPGIQIVSGYQNSWISAALPITLEAIVTDLDGLPITLPIEWAVEGAGQIDEQGVFRGKIEGGLAEVTLIVDGVHQTPWEIYVVGLGELIPDLTTIQPNGDTSSATFGYMKTTHYPWLYFHRYGWRFISGTDQLEIWMFDPYLNYWQASEHSYFPYVWNTASSAWEILEETNQ